MTPARSVAIAATLLGAAYAIGTLLAQRLFDRSIIYPH
jgi:hypothetical protein